MKTEKNSKAKPVNGHKTVSDSKQSACNLTVYYKGKEYQNTIFLEQPFIVQSSNGADMMIPEFPVKLQITAKADKAFVKMTSVFSQTQNIPYGNRTILDKEHNISVKFELTSAVAKPMPESSPKSVKKLKHPELAAPLTPVTENDLRISRSPRVVTASKREVIQIEKPPENGGKPTISWVSVFITPAITIVVMVLMVVLTGISPIMMAMSAVLGVVSAITAVVNYRKQKKRFTQKDSTITEKYNEYLDKLTKQLIDSHRLQLDLLIRDNPSPVQCEKLASSRDKNLWNRDPYDDDFVSVRIGTGNIRANLSAEYKRPEVIIEETELEQAAAKLADTSTLITDAPILCDLLRNQQTGVIGSREYELQLCRNIVMGLVATHSPDELKIIIITSEKEASQWEWARWLPHCMDDNHEVRFVFTSKDEAEATLDDFNDILSGRNASVKDSGNAYVRSDSVPEYLFISAEPGILEKHPIRNQIFEDNNIGSSVIFVYDKMAKLPKVCDQIIEIQTETGIIYSTSDSTIRREFKLDDSSAEQAERFARSMAPLISGKAGGAASIPTSITFLQGYGVNTPEQLNIRERWANAKTYKSLSVPIAAMAGGDLFSFDIHPKHHGSHGIVAGTTGSGKTEMVQAWLLSLAVNFSPEDLNFILIDFKGTGLIAPFRDLPHVAGTISNLDTNIDRNLIAIKNEVHRREKLIDKYSDYGVHKISDLNSAFASGKIQERLPVLLIVIDEYAEFKKNFPDFGTEIDSLVSKGRSLGMWLILMTQKPAGIVSAQVEDNINFRWCLKVANYAASKEMLGRNDAAKIKNSGRAFVKVGEDDIYEQVQAFYSGARYNPNQSQDTKSPDPILSVSRCGERKALEHFETVKKSETGSLNEIDVVVRHITDYCKANRIPRATQVWTEKLPERIALQELLPATFDGRKWPAKAEAGIILGIVDDPANQSKYPLNLNLAESGHTTVYGAPVTGKTTLLQTAAVSLAMTTKPDETNIYVLDFGGWNMNVLKDLPHVGGIAFDNQPERIQKLCLLLTDELARRRELLSTAGVGNISAYRDIPGSEKLPDIVLLVDNFGTMIKMYPDLDAFFITYTGSGASYGMYLLSTAGATTAVPMKISQNIKNAICLQMIDKSDYTYLVGKVSSQLPQIAGRGLIKGNPPLEFQTALPADGENDKLISDAIKTLAEQMNSAWTGNLPDSIPEMPDVIPFQLLKSNDIMLGLSTDKVKPVTWRPQNQHYLMISGISQSGKSNLLQAAALQLHKKLGGKFVAFDVLGNGLKTIRPAVDTYLNNAAQIDEFIEALRPELQKRYTLKQNGAETAFEPIVIAIDDFGTFFKQVSNDTILRLRAIVLTGLGMNLYLVIAGDAYEITSMYNKGEALTMSMVKNRDTVMLGGCMNDHGAIQTKATFHQKSDSVEETEGFFVSKTAYTRMKTMFCGGAV